MSERIFLEEISIGFSRQSKDVPSPVSVGIIQFIEGPKRTKGKGRANLSPFVSLELPFFCPTTSVLVLEPSDSGTYTIVSPGSWAFRQV